MFDISWTEFLLIGVVALVVIGPKELPGVMRTMGQWTRKIRGMAADFQNQFQEAMREAEMTDLKKQVDDMAHDIKSYDPLKSAREDVENIGKDLSKDFEKKPLDLLKPAEQSAAELDAPEQSAIEQNPSAATEPALPAPETPPVSAPEPASAVPESTERTG
jgi:sec-independent protein translocase protein TatB